MSDTLLSITLNHYIFLAAALFFIGLAGLIINRGHLIRLLISIEIMLLGVNLNFVAFSAFKGSMEGQVFAMMILTVAAAELAIGLALLVQLYTHHKSTLIDNLSEMKG